MNNTELINNQSKPIAIILYPQKTDEAFNTENESFKKRKGQLEKNYQVKIIKPESIGDACEKIEKITNEHKGRLLYLELAGHGTKCSLLWNKNNGTDGTISTKNSEKLKKLIDLTSPEGVILTQSCLNGVEVENGQNLLQLITSLAKIGQRVVGSSVEDFDFNIYSSYPLHFTYTGDVSQKDVTRVYYHSSADDVVEVTIEEFTKLWQQFNDNHKAIDLCYKILGEKSNLRRFCEIREELKEFFAPDAVSSLINQFQGETHRKEENTTWSKLLSDLDEVNNVFGLDNISSEIAFTPQMRQGFVERKEKELVVPKLKCDESYHRVYLRILGLAALQKNATLIALFDNGRDYFNNPAAQMIFALTGEVIHSEGGIITPFLLGNSSIPQMTIKSYLYAKKQNDLPNWFQKAFEGICFNEFGNNLSTYYQGCLPIQTVEKVLVLLKSDMTLFEIVEECVEGYQKNILLELSLSEPPEETDLNNSIRYECGMTEQKALQFIQEKLRKFGIDQGKDFDTKSITEELQKYCFSTEESKYDYLPNLIKKDIFTKWEIANLVAEHDPIRVSENLHKLSFTLDEAVTFCRDKSLNDVNLEPYESLVDDHVIERLTQSNPEIHELRTKSNKITADGIKKLVDRNVKWKVSVKMTNSLSLQAKIIPWSVMGEPVMGLRIRLTLNGIQDPTLGLIIGDKSKINIIVDNFENPRKIIKHLRKWGYSAGLIADQIENSLGELIVKREKKIINTIIDLLTLSHLENCTVSISKDGSLLIPNHASQKIVDMHKIILQEQQVFAMSDHKLKERMIYETQEIPPEKRILANKVIDTLFDPQRQVPCHLSEIYNEHITRILMKKVENDRVFVSGRSVLVYSEPKHFKGITIAFKQLYSSEIEQCQFLEELEELINRINVKRLFAYEISLIEKMIFDEFKENNAFDSPIIIKKRIQELKNRFNPNFIVLQRLRSAADRWEECYPSSSFNEIWNSDLAEADNIDLSAYPFISDDYPLNHIYYPMLIASYSKGYWGVDTPPSGWVANVPLSFKGLYQKYVNFKIDQYFSLNNFLGDIRLTKNQEKRIKSEIFTTVKADLCYSIDAVESFLEENVKEELVCANLAQQEQELYESKIEKKVDITRPEALVEACQKEIENNQNDILWRVLLVKAKLFKELACKGECVPFADLWCWGLSEHERDRYSPASTYLAISKIGLDTFEMFGDIPGFFLSLTELGQEMRKRGFSLDSVTQIPLGITKMEWKLLLEYLKQEISSFDEEQQGAEGTFKLMPLLSRYFSSFSERILSTIKEETRNDPDKLLKHLNDHLEQSPANIILQGVVAQARAWKALRKQTGDSFPFEEVWRYAIDGSQEKHGPFIFENEPGYLQGYLNGLALAIESSTTANVSPQWYIDLHDRIVKGVKWPAYNLTYEDVSSGLERGDVTYGFLPLDKDPIGVKDLRERGAIKQENGVENGPIDSLYEGLPRGQFVLLSDDNEPNSISICIDRRAVEDPAIWMEKMLSIYHKKLKQTSKPEERMLAALWLMRELEINHVLSNVNGFTSMVGLVGIFANDPDLPMVLFHDPTIVGASGPEKLCYRTLEAMLNFRHEGKHIPAPTTDEALALDDLRDLPEEIEHLRQGCLALVKNKSWGAIHRWMCQARS